MYVLYIAYYIQCILYILRYTRTTAVLPIPHLTVVLLGLALDVGLVGPEAPDGDDVRAGELAVEAARHAQHPGRGAHVRPRDLEDAVVVAVWKMNTD